MKNKFDIKALSLCSDTNIGFDISREYDENPKDFYPIFLFIPNIKDLEKHHHIPLTKKDARALHVWLGSYLNDVEKT